MDKNEPIFVFQVPFAAALRQALSHPGGIQPGCSPKDGRGQG